jgi:hypothetical protein
MLSNLPLLNRHEVQSRVKQKFCADYSPRTIESLPIPYILVGRCALYDAKDVDDYFERLVSEAPRRLGGRGRSAGLPGHDRCAGTVA